MIAGKRNRAIALLAGAMCALSLMATPAFATVRQVGKPTKTSFTIGWDKWTSTSSSDTFKNYQVLVGKDYSSAKVYKTIDSVDSTSCTVSGLPAGAKRFVQVKANYVYTSSYDKQTEYDSFLGSVYDAKTLPGKVSGLKQDRWYYFILEFIAKWNPIESADGYQWVCYKDNGKKFRSGTATSGDPSATVNKVKNNQIYKMKVRAYTSVDGKRVNGAWSPYSYFFTQPRVKAAKVANGKLTVKWDKVSGATGYTVYVSAKAKKGYTKVGTVGKGRSSLTVRKLAGKKIKNNKKYYVYVVTNKKVNGKTSTSGRLYYWNTKDGASSYGYF